MTTWKKTYSSLKPGTIINLKIHSPIASLTCTFQKKDTAARIQHRQKKLLQSILNELRILFIKYRNGDHTVNKIIHFFTQFLPLCIGHSHVK